MTAPTSLATSRGTLAPMLRLAMPVLLEYLLHMVVIYSDTVLAGYYLGEADLAAISVLYYAIWLVENMFGVVSIGTAALVARFVGAGDWALARRVTCQSLAAGGVLSSLVVAVVVAGAPLFFSAVQMEGESARLATHYLWIVALAVPCMMVEIVAVAALRGAGDTVTGLIVMGIVDLVNLAVSWSLVTGWGPFPELGWYGLAIGTTTAHLAGGLLLIWLLARGRAGLKLQAGSLRPDMTVIRRILRIGIPGGTDVLLIILCHMWFLGIINSLGDLATAAHGVGVKIEGLAYLPGTAFQVAAATMIGQFLGAGDHRRAARGVLTSVLAGGAVMSAVGALFFLFPEPLVRLFVSARQEEVIEMTVPLLQVVAFSTPPLAVLMIVGGALRGAGDTRVPLVLNLLGFLGVRIPGAYLLAHVVGLGLIGAWYAMVGDVVIRCLFMVVRFRLGAWKRVTV